jgi:hypothetical protein|tara:strand:- start:2748 stop:2951 length:204 start_codon:yes stop_codon:yes gene_type:complete
MLSRFVKILTVVTGTSILLVSLLVFSLLVSEAVIFPGAVCSDRGDVWHDDAKLCEDLEGNLYRIEML